MRMLKKQINKDITRANYQVGGGGGGLKKGRKKEKKGKGKTFF